MAVASEARPVSKKGAGPFVSFTAFSGRFTSGFELAGESKLVCPLQLVSMPGVVSATFIKS